MTARFSFLIEYVAILNATGNENASFSCKILNCIYIENMTQNYGLESGTRITYRVIFRNGEPKFEDREGIIEGNDSFCHAPGHFDAHKYYSKTDEYLVKCTSCNHHRIDTVHPNNILSIHKISDKNK